MRVAVMSDIHGFDLALATVLTDLKQRGPFDEVVVAGDLCEVGPAPGRVLAMLQAEGFTLIRGNTDQELVEAAATGRSDSAEIAYALADIGDAGVATLAALPSARRITPPGGHPPADDLLVVHANPHDLETKMTLEMSDDELRAVLGEVPAAAIAFGHHHVAFTREVDGVLLADVSAVGNPKDGDLRAKYGILTWDEEGESWTAEIVRLEYPVDETSAEMRASGMPGAETAIRNLLKASYDD